MEKFVQDAEEAAMKANGTEAADNDISDEESDDLGEEARFVCFHALSFKCELCMICWSDVCTELMLTVLSWRSQALSFIHLLWVMQSFQLHCISLRPEHSRCWCEHQAKLSGQCLCIDHHLSFQIGQIFCLHPGSKPDRTVLRILCDASFLLPSKHKHTPPPPCQSRLQCLCFCR